MVGPVNPPSRGYIWILLATEYFTKWAEVVPLQKATGGAVVNFIKENIIVRFGVPQRIISDNGTPFVNSDVRKMLEFYQVKHHRSSPYYPQGNGQVEGTNKVLIKIEPRVHRRMGNAPARCPLGLQKITEVYHRIFILFLGIRDGSSKPSKVMTPSLRVMQIQEKEKKEEAFTAERCEDLEGLDERREEAQEHSHKY